MTDRNRQNILHGKDFTLFEYCELFSSLTTDSFYVLDIPQKQFDYIKPHDLFLCGYPVEEAVANGWNFYQRIVYPEDLTLCAEMFAAILSYLTDREDQREEIDYFSCTFRLTCTYSFMTSRIIPQMVYQKMKPIWKYGELQYLICSIKSSTVSQPGNLLLIDNDKSIYEIYNFNTKRWKQKKKKQLTEREKSILMLASQGKNSREIAEHLLRGQNTIRNQIKALFAKLQVNSMQEAIELFSCHDLIYFHTDGKNGEKI